ncbi:MAG: TonB-dependent receptor [Rhizobiaceae bacterium]
MRHRNFRRYLLTTFAAISVLPTAAHHAVAQESVVLGEIVITSRKRAETEEKAPVSTTVLEAKDVPASTLDSAAEIAKRSPNVNFIDYSRFGESFLNIRGVSTLGSPLNSLDSTVGFAVDGVPTSVLGFGPPLLDVERVEVLRGPQGTTFGRNSLAGTINVVSRPADGERELRVDTEIGTNGHAYVQGTADGWIVPDKVAGRGVVRFQKFDGDVPNPLLGEDIGGAQLGAARGALRFTPDDTWTIDISGNFSRDDRSNPAYLLYTKPDFPVSGEDVEPQQLRTIGQGTINISKELESVILTSVTSYQHTDIRNYADFTDSYFFGAITGLPPELLFNPDADKIWTDEKEGVFNQEFRVNSAQDSDWQWVLGTSVFYADYEMHREAGTALVPFFNGTFDNRLTSSTYAVFGDATVPVGERWEVSGGLRLAHDRQSFAGDYVSNGAPGTVPIFHQEGEVSDTYLTGRAALSYAWTDDIISYAALARGYSSGGFEKAGTYAPFAIASPPFLPAKGWTYELGTKAQVTDRVALRSAVFYNDVSDGVLSGFDPATFQVFLNNQDYRSYGAELSGSVDLTDTLRLNAGIGYTKSEMVDVDALSALAGAQEGNAVPQVPAWTATLGLEYTLPGEAFNVSGNFTAGVNYQYVGARYSDLANDQKMPEYHMVNARIGWENERFGFHAFVNNLLDERPLSFQVALPQLPLGTGSVTGVYATRGRVAGLGASLKF